MNIIRITRLVARLALPSLALLLASCARADSVANYDPPEKAELVPFGTWGTSGKLMFRVIKVVESKFLGQEGPDVTGEKAPRGMRFVVLTVDAMPYDQGKATLDLPRSVSLMDATGLAYKPNSERFTVLNGGAPEFRIDAGEFAERTVAFLVPKDFKPAALRCSGAEDTKPCLLALTMQEP